MIPVEAVEAAAKAVIAALKAESMGYVSAEYVTDMVIDVSEFDMLAAMRAALEAAAPFIIPSPTSR